MQRAANSARRGRRVVLAIAILSVGLAAQPITRVAADPAGAPPQATAPSTPLPPVAVALDATLIRPQPGDSPATRAARAVLARAQRTYAAANQRYDAAAAQADAAATSLEAAQQIALIEEARATSARDAVAAMALDLYESGNPIPASVQVLLSANGGDVLNDLERRQQIATYQAQKTQAAVTSRDAANQAEAQLEAARTLAAATQADALAAQRNAASLVADTQRAVSALHIKDLEAQARAAAARARVAGMAGHGLDGPAGAALALKAEAMASGAATTAQFPAHATLVATIDIAARALLARAARAGATPTDERHVMGPTPDLGATASWKGHPGTGSPQALTAFDGHASTSNWPSAGVGTKVAGTAPFLKPDGVSVHPKLPAYKKGYRPLRAQVAVDAALAQLGSPYVWDAAGATTFDCSGLIVWAWGHAGVTLQHFTGSQVQEGVRVEPNELLPGDLVLFGADLHHIGMYLGAGYMLDAPQTGDYVKIQLVSDMGDFAVAVRP